MTPQSATIMARYNQRMNEGVFDAAASLGHEELVADKGAFFGSILGTLNHIAVADTIWLHRFGQYPGTFAALGALARFPIPSSLRQVLAPDLPALHHYRRRLDELILRWVAELTPANMSDQLSYANMAGVVSSRSFSVLIQHFFNHQTHHRGQVSTLLFQSGVDIGVTDLPAVIPGSEA